MLIAFFAVKIVGALVISSGALFHSFAASMLKLCAAILSLDESLKTLLDWFLRSCLLVGLSLLYGSSTIA